MERERLKCVSTVTPIPELRPAPLRPRPAGIPGAISSFATAAASSGAATASPGAEPPRDLNLKSFSADLIGSKRQLLGFVGGVETAAIEAAVALFDLDDFTAGWRSIRHADAIC